MKSALPAPARTPSLFNLQDLPLDGYHQAIWDTAQKVCAGPAPCRQRLLAEARDLLALAELSKRLLIYWLDLSSGGLRAKVALDVPVPCLRDPAGQLEIASRALLGLHYPQQAVLMPQPGTAFVRILLPRAVWHSNVSRDYNQVLCLGPKLPAGILLKEIILMVFGALSMQTIQLDLLDPAGVLNPSAGDWWQRNTSRIPLTREPFVRNEVPHVV